MSNMKPRIKRGDLTVHYQFTLKISDVRLHFRHEMKKMTKQLEAFCEKNNLHFPSMVLYRSEERDRRHMKTIPKGYRQFRYSYTQPRNISWELR